MLEIHFVSRETVTVYPRSKISYFFCRQQLDVCKQYLILDFNVLTAYRISNLPVLHCLNRLILKYLLGEGGNKGEMIRGEKTSLSFCILMHPELQTSPHKREKKLSSSLGEP